MLGSWDKNTRRKRAKTEVKHNLLSWVHPGCSVFAGPPVDGAALASLESQGRYTTRPALAMNALRKLEDGPLSLETPVAYANSHEVEAAGNRPALLSILPMPPWCSNRTTFAATRNGPGARLIFRARVAEPLACSRFGASVRVISSDRRYRETGGLGLVGEKILLTRELFNCIYRTSTVGVLRTERERTLHAAQPDRPFG